MNVLFIYPDIATSKGVLKKIEAKVNLLHAQGGIQCEVIFFGEKVDSGAYAQIQAPVSVVHIQPYKSNPILRRKPFWSRLYEQQMDAIYAPVLQEIQKHPSDVVVLRDFPMSRSGVQFFRRLGQRSKVILEINTVIESELEMKTTNAKMGDWYKIEWEKERRYKSEAIENVSGIIPVTRELDQYIQSLVGRSIPSMVFSNGVSIPKNPNLKFPEGDILKGIFLAGTSSEWNGIDRLERSIESYKGSAKLLIHVYGAEPFEPIARGNAQMEYRSPINAAELNATLSNYHFGISTLALFRKKMNEASTLKVRDYLAHGLPIVLAYDDTDLSKDDSFVYQVANDESNIDFDKVLTWLSSNISERLNWKQEISEMAANRLGYASKINQLANFLFEIHGQDE